MQERALAQVAKEYSISPLDILMQNASYFYNLALNAQSQEDIITFRMLARENAKDAAPYCHPKFATIEHIGETNKAVKIEWVLPETMLN